MKGNKGFKIRKNESFCWGVNPFRNAKLCLLSNAYCFTTCTCKVDLSNHQILLGLRLTLYWSIKWKLKGTARKGGGKSFAKSFLNCSRKTLVVLQSSIWMWQKSSSPLRKFLPWCAISQVCRRSTFWPESLESDHWPTSCFLGDFLAPFQTYWL